MRLRKLLRPTVIGLALAGVASAAFASPVPTLAPVAIVPTKSISNWAICDGVTDDSQNVARAFAAAKNAAFTLVVDCPVYLHIGMDVARSIFIDNGTTVVFTAAGKFTLDNVLHPAFVIANSYNITLTNWNVEYDASLPVNWDVGGYFKNGTWISLAGYAQPASVFNSTLTTWLAANRKVSFDQSAGNAGSQWAGPTNSCAVFFLSGDTSNVTVTGMRIYAPATAGGDRFVPMAFSMTQNYKGKQTVSANTANTAQFSAVPHHLTFTDIDLDGVYMGWQGTVQSASFQKIRSHRYGDLQDANGANVGGINKWFAPPHLIYINYNVTGDPGLYSSNIHIADVIDYGVRVGTARDKPTDQKMSGTALSLKLGCIACTVDNYQSARPDGFLDVLPSNGLKISNVVASYNSTFINNLYAGWRFPASPYKNITFANILLTDTAASTLQAPIGSAGQATNQGLVFSNVQVEMKQWAGPNTPAPYIGGQDNDVAISYMTNANLKTLAFENRDTLKVNLQATPNKVKSGSAAVLSWSSQQMSACAGSGAWSGPMGPWGNRTVKLTTPGNYDFAMGCNNTADAMQTTVRVTVTP
jgi:hypothetical protein